MPEMNLGPAVAARCGPSSSSTRESLTKVQGLPFTRGRDRSQDPGDDRWLTNEANGTRRDGGDAVKLGRKDFQSDQEVRWCPGLR